MQLESSNPWSPLRWFKHVIAVQACYRSTQKNQTLGVQEHIVKRLMANTTRKFIAELLVALINALSLIKCHSTEREGGRKMQLDELSLLNEASLVCLFQLYPSCTSYASK